MIEFMNPVLQTNDTTYNIMDHGTISIEYL